MSVGQDWISMVQEVYISPKYEIDAKMLLSFTLVMYFEVFGKPSEYCNEVILIGAIKIHCMGCCSDPVQNLDLEPP